jgi:hypothetical protein
LWETSSNDDVWRGLSDNYLTVTTSCTANLVNRILPTRIVGMATQGLRGEVIFTESI